MAAALPMCYHGSISKTECEALLGKKNKNGAYLIRDSETIQGAMCLCVYKQRVVYTYRLLLTHTGLYTLMTAGGVDEMFFKTLDDLIRHYKKKNQGLTMHLRHSVKRKTAMLIKLKEPLGSSGLPGPAGPSGPLRPQRKPSSEDEPDYENVPDSSDYVEVLPPRTSLTDS